MAIVRRSFALDSERDAGVLAWLDAQPNASEAIRAALRAAFEGRPQTEATLADVVQAIEGLGERLAGLQAQPAGAPGVVVEEDPELAAALEALGT